MNKTVTRFITFVFATLAVLGCDHTSVDPGTEDGGKVDVQLDPTPEYLLDIPSVSLLGGDTLEEGDTLGVFVINGDEVYLAETEVFISDGGKIAFEYNKPEGILEGDLLCVYSPFSQKSTPENPSAVSFSIPAVQKQIGKHFVENRLPRVAAPYKAEYALPIGRKVVACTLPLQPLYSVAEFRISYPKPEFESKALTAITYHAEGVSGDFVCDLTTGKMEMPAISGSSVTVELEDIVMPKADGSVVSVYIAIAPGTHSGKLKINVEGGETEIVIPETFFNRDSLTTVPVVISAPSHSDPENPDDSEPGTDPEPGNPDDSEPGTDPEPGNPDDSEPGTDPEPGNPDDSEPGDDPESGNPDDPESGTDPEPGTPDDSEPGTEPDPDEPETGNPGEKVNTEDFNQLEDYEW